MNLSTEILQQIIRESKWRGATGSEAASMAEEIIATRASRPIGDEEDVVLLSNIMTDMRIDSIAKIVDAAKLAGVGVISYDPNGEGLSVDGFDPTNFPHIFKIKRIL